MKGARTAQCRPYWIRYVVAFWAVEKLTWAKDNVLIACVCSLAPGLIAAGISAAISDHKWRAAVLYAHAPGRNGRANDNSCPSGSSMWKYRSPQEAFRGFSGLNPSSLKRLQSASTSAT